MVARPPVGDLIGDLKTVTTTMRASVEIVAIDMAARGRYREGYSGEALTLSRNAGRARGTCQVEASLDLAPSIIDGIRRHTLIAERRSTVASAASTCSNSFMGLTAPSWA